MIDIAQTDDVLQITISRPDKANALSEAMLADLADAVENSRAKLLILTGAGKVFSAGADLDEVRGGGLALSPQWERLSGAVAAYPGLTIAALNGTVAGGAMGMVLACDIRLAVEGAKFFYPVMKLGYLPQPSDPKRMAGLVGPSRAKLILMGGQKITTQEALAFGLIDRIADDPVATAREIGADVLAAEADHVGAIKAMI